MRDLRWYLFNYEAMFHSLLSHISFQVHRKGSIMPRNPVLNVLQVHFKLRKMHEIKVQVLLHQVSLCIYGNLKVLFYLIMCLQIYISDRKRTNRQHFLKVLFTGKYTYIF